MTDLSFYGYLGMAICIVSPADDPGGIVTLIETPEGKGIWTQTIVTRTQKNGY